MKEDSEKMKEATVKKMRPNQIGSEESTRKLMNPSILWRAMWGYIQ